MPFADLLMTAWLVAVLPAIMLARSLAARGRPPGGDRVRRYQRTLRLVAGSLLALAALWIAGRRPVAWLGLGVPDRTGLILLGLAVGAIATLAIVAPHARKPTDPARAAAAALMMPRGAREVRWFVAFAVVVGAGWELLYRGYLFWLLAPLLGPAGAVAVMAVSYGVAHGWRGIGALAGSIAAALFFAGGYALTGTLWWLIVLHVGLPLIGLRVRPAT